MGAIVIDELIVQLGLDPKGFNQGSRDAVEGLNKTRHAAESAGKDIERSGERGAQFYAKLRGELLGLLAVFTAGRGLKEFISQTVQSDAELGRLARTTDTSTSRLSAWGNMQRMVGGSVMSMARTMHGLVQEFQNFALTGQSNVLPYFRALHVNIADVDTGRMRDIGDILMDLSKAVEGMDPARAAALLRGTGLDEDTINLLLQGPAALRAMLEEQKKLGTVTEQNAKAAQALQRAWAEFDTSATTVGRNLLTQGTPALMKFLGALTGIAQWSQQHPRAIKAAFIGIAGAIGVLTIAITALTVASSPWLAALLAISGALSAIAYGVMWIEDRWNKNTGLVGRSTQDDYLAGYKGKRQAPWYGNNRGVGNVDPYAKDDMAALQKMGWSREQAAGIVASIGRESGGSVLATGDNGSAYGLAQWHPDRQQAFAKWAGHDIRRSSRAEQLAFIDYELRHGSEKAAGRRLMNAKSAAEAGAIVSRYYERPANGIAEAAARANAATKLVAGGNKSVHISSETHIGKVEVHTKATDAKGIAKDIKPALKRTGLATQSNYGAN